MTTQRTSLMIHLACSQCGREEDAAGLIGVCPACGAPMLARYDLRGAREAAGGAPPGPPGQPPDVTRRPRSLWRFRELLPPSDPAERVTLGEGMTPLLGAPRLEAEVARAAGRGAAPGISLYIKEEGTNPTLSFKARGMAMAVTAARARGARKLAVPSAGNAGGALAAYAARAGLAALVVLPADTPPAFAAEARRLGAEVELVPGLISDAGRRVAERRDEGWFDLSTFKEPYRLEGKKTLGFEIVEDLGWHYPDWIVYPTGGGTGLVGMWKAFAEMEALGWVGGRRPRMVVVQAEGCAPIVSAFERGAERAEPPPEPRTRAWGLRVPKPFADRLILAAARESGGLALAVTEEEIAAREQELARLTGLDACPEGGAAWAGVLALARAGGLAPGEIVVLVNTGAGVKYRGAGG